MLEPCAGAQAVWPSVHTLGAHACVCVPACACCESLRSLACAWSWRGDLWQPDAQGTGKPHGETQSLLTGGEGGRRQSISTVPTARGPVGGGQGGLCVAVSGGREGSSLGLVGWLRVLLELVGDQREGDPGAGGVVTSQGQMVTLEVSQRPQGREAPPAGMEKLLSAQRSLVPPASFHMLSTQLAQAEPWESVAAPVLGEHRAACLCPWVCGCTRATTRGGCTPAGARATGLCTALWGAFP